MTFRGGLALRFSFSCCVAVGALSGCADGTSLPEGDAPGPAKVPARCDPEATVDPAGRALVITDPEALSGLALEDVLSKLLEEAGDEQTTPLELAQRLFDTDNADGAGVFSDGIHCDSEANAAHANGPAAFCPRVEGALAASDGFFTPGHPDHFRPVAAVNRMDLGDASFSCGEFRIVYAKDSGLEDPDDRVFVNFELSLPNPGSWDTGCNAVAWAWKDFEEEPDPAVVAAKLRSFFFDVLPPASAPLLRSAMLGDGFVVGADYYGGGGQIRISEHMDEHWQMRQLVASTRSADTLRFVPTTVASNPLPDRFEAKLNDSSDAAFALDFVVRNLDGLAAPQAGGFRTTARPEDLAGESAMGGEAINDYAARGAGNQFLIDLLAKRIEERGLGADCPPDDPLTPDAILRRATVDSCVGCHAPARFLGEERKIGCGLTWPASLGEVHIDERGHLSEALTDVFLPHRAELLTEVLRTCE